MFPLNRNRRLRTNEAIRSLVRETIISPNDFIVPLFVVISVIVGMIQQFIIKYGQIGIAIPFTEIIFKPTPPLVPASTVMLMVIVLLILPNGLLGKKE